MIDGSPISLVHTHYTHRGVRGVEVRVSDVGLDVGKGVLPSVMSVGKVVKVHVHEHQGSANEGVDEVGVGVVRDSVHHVPGAVVFVLQLVRISVPVLALKEHPESLGLLQRLLDARPPGQRGPRHGDSPGEQL